MSGMKKVYDDLIVINLYLFSNMIVEGVGSQVISEIVFMKNKKNKQTESLKRIFQIQICFHLRQIELG